MNSDKENMKEPTEKQKLFSEFPPVTTQEWMDKITVDLKGVPFEKKLIWKTKEGFDVMPFYVRGDIANLKTKDVLPGEYPYVRGTKVDNNWYVRQDIDVVDPKEANEKMRTLCTKGVTSFGLHLTKKIISEESIQTLISGIDLSKIECNFTCCRTKVVELAHIIAKVLGASNVPADKIVGSVGFDVFKKQLVKGVVTDEWIGIAADLIEALQSLPRFTCIDVMGLHFTNAGAYIYQELGYSLSAGADILRILNEQKNIPIEEVSKRIRFVLGIGSNYFMEIAKFRAVRWLWALIVRANDSHASDDACKALVHAQTSTWNKTVYDAYVNLLRTQTEAMSATIAGVHSVTVQPFDATYKESDNFSERIARNQQLLLKEECHFDKVIDPAGGSYYVEHLTQAIGNEAWKLLLACEEKGGFVNEVNLGEVQKAINASNDARHKAVATRRESLLGTNIFPNFSEMVNEKVSQGDERHLCGCEKDASITPLNFHRGASDFEELRLQTERASFRPKVFMLTIGNLAMRLARSQFSSNFFACAGYEVIDNLGFQTVQEGIDAAIAAGAHIVTLCSSDDEYAEFGPQAYDALAGRMPLVIAGAPACSEDLKAKGIEHFIHVKVNVLETLRGFQKILGIAE